MGAIYDTTRPEALLEGLRLARAAIGRGGLVVIPTDTVYGVAADAFDAAAVRALAERFWPGPLTIIVTARTSLDLDLGETNGTVALRVPNDPIALELLRETGPLAVSSANRTGEPPATTAEAANAALGPSVEIVIDGGERGTLASTIVDATALPDGKLRIVRAGAVPTEEIRALLGAERVD